MRFKFEFDWTGFNEGVFEKVKDEGSRYEDIIWGQVPVAINGKKYIGDMHYERLPGERLPDTKVMRFRLELFEFKDDGTYGRHCGTVSDIFRRRFKDFCSVIEDSVIRILIDENPDLAAAEEIPA